MIDPNGPVARRFPLIPRPRPACIPLPQRVAGLRQRATEATETGDLAAASAVFNLAALLASDCGLPDLARSWCLRLARLTLTTPPADAHDAICGLEPIINLARLHTRAGEGQAAWTLLEDLYQAIATRSTISVDSIDIPVAELTADPDIYRDLRRWVWAILLSSGARALALAGRWQDARTRLERHNGIGSRMLDGRQIAVIAHASTGRHADARELLHGTEPGEPWENAVTACLQQLCEPAPGRTKAISTYPSHDPQTAGLTVFYVRLGLCIIDGVTSADEFLTRPIAAAVLQAASTDGYAAREILEHPRCRATATDQQVNHLAELVTSCGLDAGHLPPSLQTEITEALERATTVIVAHRAKNVDPRGTTAT